jgi:hypothetical protein
VIVVDPPGDRDLRLIGVVRGLVEEGPKAVKATQAFAPSAVGLGVSAAELEAIGANFVGTPSEPLVPLGPTEIAEARSLVRFGEVGVPNPAFLELLAWGKAKGIPVEGIDPDDDVQAEQFVAHIGYFELVRRTLRERRVGRRPPKAADADAFAVAWDKETRPGGGSERYAMARERSLLEALTTLREDHPRAVVVVDRERLERLNRLVGEARPTPRR